LDIDYEYKICIQAFPPGEYYKVFRLPNVTAVNAQGDFHIATDRLAFINGDGKSLYPFLESLAMLTKKGLGVDPWRPYTPHSAYGGAEEREDTVVRPFKIFPGVS
jgi:hypothetical protein